MYRKILVPTDLTDKSEAVLRLAKEQLAPDGEMILLHVIRPYTAMGIAPGPHIMPFDELEELQRSEAMERLNEVTSRMKGDTEVWTHEAVVHKSVSQGILDVAQKREADLIALYTHDRKGLARLIMGSVSGEVEREADADVDVKVFTPPELMLAS